MAERIKIEIEEGDGGVAIQFLTPDGEPEILKLTPASLLSLIQHMGDAHSLAFEGEMPAGEEHHLELEPKTTWHADPDMVGEASVLTFHHPKFGPIEFALPLDQLRRLADMLSRRIMTIETVNLPQDQTSKTSHTLALPDAGPWWLEE